MHLGTALWAVLCGLAVPCGACTAWGPHPLAPPGTSGGSVNDGWLVEGVAVPDRAEGLRAYREAERRFGSRRLAEILLETAAHLAGRFDGATLHVGDLSARGGGRIPGHRSHRSGRDVDLLFFVLDPDGRPGGRARFAKFGADGVAVGAPRPLRLDLERNWALVEHLLETYAGDVQWIFVSRGVKTALLTWAMRAGASLDTVDRALEVLHEPSDSVPHDDHYHVRLYCTGEERAAGCEDRPPIRSWVRPGRDRLPAAVTDDAALLEMALGPM